ncbi:MAG: hypothetical protein LBJ00_17770 [Planctomycetaceae bacterium]|nr:hypothetical protein [Planctomycetaceae bacterium]
MKRLFKGEAYRPTGYGINLQRRALGNRNNVKRLFGGEAYRPYWIRYTALSFCGKGVEFPPLCVRADFCR